MSKVFVCVYVCVCVRVCVQRVSVSQAKAFTFYLLFFTLGVRILVEMQAFWQSVWSVLVSKPCWTQVMNIITGVFVENASVLFKPDDREAMYRAMLYEEETMFK